MPTGYDKPEALAITWHGPISLDDAADYCEKLELKQGIYVAFGRHRSMAWWPWWWESRWVGEPDRLTTRPTRFPLQYIGIGKEVCDRAQIDGHHRLQYLSPKSTDIWFASHVNHLDDRATTVAGHLRAVFALEKALIYTLKPRLNTEHVRSPNAPVCVAWCRPSDPNARLSFRHRNQLRRLPSLIRFDPNDRVIIEFGDGSTIRFQANRAKRQPVRSLQLSWNKFLARFRSRSATGAQAETIIS